MAHFLRPNSPKLLSQVLLCLLSSTAAFSVDSWVAATPNSQTLSQARLGSQWSRTTYPFVLAQDTLDSDPNQDRFLQPSPIPEPLPEEPETPTPAPEPIPTPTDSDDIQSFVENIEVTGSTVFRESEFAPILEPLEGTEVTLAQLETAADAITQLYLDQGYITSRAILLEDSLGTSTPEIRVIEGRIEEIIIEGTERLPDAYARSRIRLGAETPLSAARLEEQLRLLKANPLFSNVEASLQAGTGIGQSILTVRVEEADPWSANFNLDNYSPPSVGAVRVGAAVSTLNLTGIGDQADLSYYRTTAGGAESFGASYLVPLNAMNGTLQARVNLSATEVVEGEFQDLEIEGEATLYEISYRQPLIRTPREEFALSVGFAYQDGQTFLDGSPFSFIQGADVGETITSVFKVGQEYIYRQPSGAWAVRSLFSIGTGIFEATVSNNAPDSEFLSWLGQVQRVQVINPDNFLIIQGNLQFSTDSLLPSQQFTIGGGQSLRGYRQNARAGDNGFRFSVEDRIVVQRNDAGNSTLQVAPFFDAGVVWNDEDNPNTLPNQRFLAGLGVGVLWQPLTDLNVRIDYAYPFIDLDDQGDNLQDNGVYFSLNYLF
jgi:hemolysin activation/secretion protein